MAINLKQYTGSTITPTDDALLYDFIMSEQSGIFEGCEVTHLGANQLQISDGRGLIRGRVFTVSQQTILANVSSSGSVKGRLIVKVDLGNVEAPIALVTQAASALPELTQQDINRDGTVFELPLATYDVTEVLISGLASVANKLTAPIDDKLKQSVANLKKGKYNATAKKSGTTVAITGPAGAETVVFVAPSDWAAGDKYTYNGTALTLATLTGEPVEDAWKSGSPIQFFIQGNKAFFKAGGGSKIPQNLPPLNPNFSVKRTGGSITAKADKLLVGNDTSMLAGGVWVYKANGIPQNPKDGTVKKWSVADLVDMGAAKAGGKMVQLKDIPVATTSSPTYTMLSDNGNGSYTFVGESPAATLEWTFQFPETTPCYVRQYTFNQKGQYQTMLQGAVASTEDKPPYSAVLAENTWEQIALACETGDPILDLWLVGDKIDVSVGGEILTFAIMGKNMDDLADGSGKAHLTFGMTQLMAARRQMNGSNTNSGSFAGSAMYSWLSGSVYSGLNSELKKAIKAVNKKTSAGDGSSSIRTDAMRLWLFSEVEVFGTTTHSYAGEGLHYPYFATVSERIKKLSNGTGAVSHWWERSPHTTPYYGFCFTDTSGSTNYTAAQSLNGVCFGFCI